MSQRDPYPLGVRVDEGGNVHDLRADDGVRYCAHCGIAEAAASGIQCPDPRVFGAHDGERARLLRIDAREAMYNGLVRRAARLRREADTLDQEARVAEMATERFDAPGCPMCGAADGDPCDCHDPQGER